MQVVGGHDAAMVASHYTQLQSLIWSTFTVDCSLAAVHGLLAAELPAMPACDN